MLVAITGKGPLKQHYERRVAGLALRRIGIATLSVARAGRLNDDDQEPHFLILGIATLWLEPADYPVLLGCADLGTLPLPPSFPSARAASLHAARRDQASACTAPPRDSTCR